jgi:hypothetical protein
MASINVGSRSLRLWPILGSIVMYLTAPMPTLSLLNRQIPKQVPRFLSKHAVIAVLNIGMEARFGLFLI